MKKLIYNCFLFIIPIITLSLIEILLPSTFFSFRTWEGISFTTDIPHQSTFYPNSKTFMNASGDLCHHTNKAVSKHELWITDKLGFRNNKFIKAADILFIGDSFIAGSGLSQNEIISNKVKIKLKNNVKVYNMAPSSFLEFDYFLKNGFIKKPKLIIFSIVERYIPTSFVKYRMENTFTKTLSNCNMNVYIDKGLRFSSIKWLKARIQNSKGFGIPSQCNTNMFFLQGNQQKHKKDDLQTTLLNLLAYKKYCDSLGISFIFLPMPDKESVYYDLIPFDKQPNYLFQLDSLLHEKDILTINTLKIYNNYRKTNKNLIYHLDDTHWNSNATEIISKEIVKFIYDFKRRADSSNNCNLSIVINSL